MLYFRNSAGLVLQPIFTIKFSLASCICWLVCITATNFPSQGALIVHKLVIPCSFWGRKIVPRCIVCISGRQRKLDKSLNLTIPPCSRRIRAINIAGKENLFSHTHEQIKLVEGNLRKRLPRNLLIVKENFVVCVGWA